MKSTSEVEIVHPLRLSQRLAPLFQHGFYRPLARPSAPVYVDAIDLFEVRSSEEGQLSHEETLALIREVLIANPSAHRTFAAAKRKRETGTIVGRVSHTP